MKILKLSSNQEQIVSEAVSCLKTGGLVIYPTETVYGIGAAANHSGAISKLLAYKGRREGKPLSIAVTDQKMAEQYVEINAQAQKFYKNFLPGPYTVISKSKNQVDPRVNSEFGTLGIRIPAHPLIIQVIDQLGQAITSTSANASGKKRPYRIQDIFEHLSNKQKALVDLVIDAGELPKNEPSTVIDTTLSTPIALRGSLQTDTQAEIFWSKDENDTIALAGRLLLNHLNDLHENGLVLALNGQLGMGKTIFAKGVAKFLGIKDTISSPTYSYINEYPYQRFGTQGTFYHIDAWKIDSQAAVDFLAIKKLVQQNNLVLIEWFAQIASWLHLDQNTPLLTLNFSEEKLKRKITIQKK